MGSGLAVRLLLALGTGLHCGVGLTSFLGLVIRKGLGL